MGMCCEHIQLPLLSSVLFPLPLNPSSQLVPKGYTIKETAQAPGNISISTGRAASWAPPLSIAESWKAQPTISTAAMHSWLSLPCCIRMATYFTALFLILQLLNLFFVFFYNVPWALRVGGHILFFEKGSLTGPRIWSRPVSSVST